MSLDAARLDAIRERLDKASPGPWRPCSCDKCGLVWTGDASDEIICDAHGWREEDGLPPNQNKVADKRLIGHAPTDLADLLAAHDALTAQVAALRDTLAMSRQHFGGGTYFLALMDQLLDATAAAAEAFKRQQRLAGARSLLAAAEELLGGPHGETYFASVQAALFDMEREASA